MANQAQTDDASIEKAVWHYVGVAVLWVALLLTGIALERLGLTSQLLTGVLPGETGALRTQAAECQSKLAAVNEERNVLTRSRQALEVEVAKLKRAAASTQPASTTAVPPTPAQ